MLSCIVDQLLQGDIVEIAQLVGPVDRARGELGFRGASLPDP